MANILIVEIVDNHLFGSALSKLAPAKTLMWESELMDVN